MQLLSAVVFIEDLPDSIVASLNIIFFETFKKNHA